MPSDELQKFYESVKCDEERKEIIIARCATDVRLFAELFFPHYCTREFNPFHQYLFDSFKFNERGVRRANAAPRGAAKSTFISLIKPIHDIAYSLERFILIISNTGPLSVKKLKDIRHEITSNRDLCEVYGLHFKSKKPSATMLEIFGDYGSTYLAALGRGAEVRGIRHNETRPSKIICDDVEHSEEVYNEKTRAKTEDWFFEDVTKAGDTGTTIDFLGTVLHKDSLLSKLLKNPSYTGKTFKSITRWSSRMDLWKQWEDIYIDISNENRLADAQAFYESHKKEMLEGTEVLWPEKEDYLAHMKDRAEIGERAFEKEKQNNPKGSDDQIFQKFHFYREIADGFQVEETGEVVKWEDLGLAFAAMDPATGQGAAKNKGDFTVLLVGYKDRKGRVFVHEDTTKRIGPSKFISLIFDKQERFKLERFGLETNLFRDLLTDNIREEKKRLEEIKNKIIPLKIYEVHQTENKRERIFRLEPKVNNGWMMFNRRLSREFMMMFEDFPNATHDDGPDCAEMLWNMAHNTYSSGGISLDR